MNLRRTALLLCAVALTLAADTVNYKYDDAGRLISVSYANGTVIAYTYDPAGNLLSRIVTNAPAASASKAKSQKASKTEEAKTPSKEKSTQ